MKIKHLGKLPTISDSSLITHSSIICGDVTIGNNSIIMHGVKLIAEGGSIIIGNNCIILENAVLRSTERHSLKIGNNVLIGPNSHIVGCTIEDDVFVATGASIFHGAKLCFGSEVRINGVVHTQSILPKNEVVPIGWVAVGNPASILPPDKHDEIWKIQKQLNFPMFVYGVDRPKPGESNMIEITKKMILMLKEHMNDEIIE